MLIAVRIASTFGTFISFVFLAKISKKDDVWLWHANLRHWRGIARDTPELVDQFVKCPMTAEAVQDASMAFKKALIERAQGEGRGITCGMLWARDAHPKHESAQWP